MTTTTVKRIIVVGDGQISYGIAQVDAMHNVHVWLFNVDPQALSKASSSISNSINRLVSKSQLSWVAGADALKRLHFTLDLEEFGDADFIIEAIVESEDVKKILLFNWTRFLRVLQF